MLTSTLVDGTFASGKVALYDAVNPQQTFDNVSLTIIPEPSTLALCGASLIVVAMRRKMKSIPV